MILELELENKDDLRTAWDPVHLEELWRGYSQKSSSQSLVLCVYSYENLHNYKHAEPLATANMSFAE